MSSENRCNVASPNECETCKTRKEPLIRISKRTNISRGKSWGIRAIALVLALIVSGLVIFLIVKLSPLKIYAAMFNGAFGTTKRAWATIRDSMQALDSPVHSATAITSLRKLPEMVFPTAA